MNFLLDTDVCSFHLRGSSKLTHRLIQYSGRVAIPTIVLAELYAGAYMGSRTNQLLHQIEEFVGGIEVVTFDTSCAEAFGRLRGELKRIGRPVPNTDLMIAAVAIARDATIVTHNRADYEAIPGLRIEDWVEG